MSYQEIRVEAKNTTIFDGIKSAVANISKINYYDTNRNTGLKFDSSDNELGATLKQQTNEGDWNPNFFASRYLNIQF